MLPTPTSPDAPQAETIEEWEILDLLDGLAEKSLVVVETIPGGEVRYRLLETVRAYAQDRLFRDLDSAAVRRRHLARFTDLATSAEPEGPEAAHWLDRLDREHGNLRKALQTALEEDSFRLDAARLAGCLHWFWDTRGRLEEGRRWCEAALEHYQEPTLERAAVLQGAGNIAHSQGLYRDAEAYHAEALGIRRAHSDMRGVARSLGSLAKAALNLGDTGRARELFDESLAASREAGDRSAEAATLINYGILMGGEGEHEEARRLFEAARRICHATGNNRVLLYAVSCLASEDFFAGDFLLARERHLEALEMCRELGDRVNTAYTLEGLAATDLRLTLYSSAARLYGAADSLRVAIGSPARPANREALEEDRRMLLDALGEEEFRRRYEEGKSQPLEGVLDELTASSRR